jgi:hypothetical protein
MFNSNIFKMITAVSSSLSIPVAHSFMQLEVGASARSHYHLDVADTRSVSTCVATDGA